jgi:hypothetical protein
MADLKDKVVATGAIFTTGQVYKVKVPGTRISESFRKLMPLD